MKKIYVDCLSKYYRAALTEEGVLTELIFQDKESSALVGDIYVGRVEKVLPSGIAFVNIGKDKPVFLQGKSIKCGKDVIVQIEKEAVNEKCAVVTDKISLNGKYCVVIYNDKGIGISKKISSSSKREQLKAIGEKYTESNMGIIFRTNCENADVNDVENEMALLKKELFDLMERGQVIKAPYLLKKEADIITRTIRDIITSDCDSVIINADVPLEYSAQLYTGSAPMFNYFGIESQIEKLFHKKIWLKSGGYIVIDETEAMTVIDVNSGKAIDEKSFVKINKEAAKEAARQIRLRNLSGMIIIDFINVKGGNADIYNTLEKYLALDRVKTYIVGMTELGLMQLTRQKKRKPLSKYISHKCPVCDGTGYVRSIEYICSKIINEVTDIFASTIYDEAEISSSEKVISCLKDNVKNIENMFNKHISLTVIPTVRYDYYKIHKGISRE